MNIFDVIGPVMIGPSSSHTAGAVRLSLLAISILGAWPVKAQIALPWQLCPDLSRPWYGYGAFGRADGLVAR